MTLVLVALLAAFQPPTVVRTSTGEIPYGAAAAGVVGLEASVSDTGAITGVRVVKPLEPFTGPFSQSVRGWQAEPAREDGAAVASHLLVLGVFRPAMLMYPEPPPPDHKDFGLSADVPEPTKWSIPGYPPTAQGMDTAVIVDVAVGEDGTVTDARVTTSTPGFDDASLAAARAWAFKPATRNGRAVPSHVVLAFYFRAPH
jgi:TonB family protein